MDLHIHTKKIKPARSGMLSCLPRKKQSPSPNICKSPNFINFSGIDLGMSPQSRLPKILNANQSYKRGGFSRIQKKFQKNLKDEPKEINLHNANNNSKYLNNSSFAFDQLLNFSDIKPKRVSQNMGICNKKLNKKALVRKSSKQIIFDFKEPATSHSCFPPSKCIKSKSFISILL